jgi:cell division protein FtsA
MHLITAAAGPLRNLQTCVERCHLDIQSLVISPYASGLATLVEDEMDLGVTVIDMGGGTTTIAVFFDGHVIYTDSLAIGGGHVTNDIARGLSTPLAHAERMKTLYGNCIPSPADEREVISVPQVGEEDPANATTIPKSILVGIIQPRLEETFELVRSRLEHGGYGKIAGRRVVLTGGASQLSGVRELAALVLDKQVRMGRPIRIGGLAEATGGPAFATAVGLLAYGTSAEIEMPRPSRIGRDEPNGLIGSERTFRIGDGVMNSSASSLSFPRKRESRAAGLGRLPWMSAFAGMTRRRSGRLAQDAAPAPTSLNVEEQYWRL